MNKTFPFDTDALIPLFLAPMAGITDWCFRLLCEEQGCDIATTEMISAQGYMTARKSIGAYRRLTARAHFEKPLLAQIFGTDPSWMAEAAKALTDTGRFVGIDINMGCPARKVTGGGAGSALMRDESLAGRIIGAVSAATALPVSVKMRLGWDENTGNAASLARIAELEGAKLVTVHGRTREQQYSGKADWEGIAKVRRAVSIPVVANGDIADGPSALRALKVTGCQGLAVGRAALGNPWVFMELRSALNGEICSPVDIHERLQTARRHAAYMRAAHDERTALLEMRKFFAWYIKGVRGAAEIRTRINTAPTFEAVYALLDQFEASVSDQTAASSQAPLPSKISD
ncbi:MAG: tRNA dihydrouridine synthase DusB [Clostridia bacterium]|nr:tRNA dihydrouridine synthase DusB [Clostridia bacterium]